MVNKIPLIVKSQIKILQVSTSDKVCIEPFALPASIAIAPVAHNASQLKETDERAGHRPGSSLRCCFFQGVDLRKASEFARTLPPLAIYHQRVSWYNLLKRLLVAHLRDTAQSNNIASKFGDPRGSDPPSTSSITQSAPKVHFQPSTVLLAKCIQKRLRKRGTQCTL